MVNICKIFGQYLQDIRPPIKILCWYCLTCYTLIIQCLFQVYKLPKNSSSWSWIQQSWVDKGKSEEEDTVSHISTVTFHVISIKWPRTNKFWMNWVWDNRKLPMTIIQGSDFGQIAKGQARRKKGWNFHLGDIVDHLLIIVVPPKQTPLRLPRPLAMVLFYLREHFRCASAEGWVMVLRFSQLSCRWLFPSTSSS